MAEPATKDDDDTWDEPAPAGADDPYKVRAYAPDKTAQMIGVWPPPGSSPGPMVGPHTQTSIRPDGTVAPYRPEDPRTAYANATTLAAPPPPANDSSGEIPAANAHQMVPWDKARTMIEGPESGGKNVFNYRHNENPTYYTASGKFQIVDSTWREGAELAGIDVSRWPHAIDAPDDVQDRVAHAIYDRYGFKPWSKQSGGPLNADGSTAAHDLGVGGTYQQHLREQLGLMGPGFDPSSMIPELDRINQQRMAAEQPLIDARMKRMKQDEAEADEQYANLKRDMDDPALKPWTEKPPQPDPIGGLASLGTVFAALASGFTHTPAIAAMNGMAAAITARDEGREHDYDQAFKAYQYNSKLALDRNALQQKAYDAAWNRVKEDPVLGLAELKSVALIYDDQQMQLLADGNLLEKADEINRSRVEAASKTAEALTKLDVTTRLGPMKGTPERQKYELRVQQLIREGHELTDAVNIANGEYEADMRGKSVAGQHLQDEQTIANQQFKDLYGRDPSPEDLKSPEMAQLREQSHSTAGMGGPENVQKMAELVAGYQMPAPSTARAIGAAVMAKVKEIAPDYNARLYSAENKALGNFYGGQEGRQTRSLNVSILHLDTYQDLAEALKGGDIRKINSAAQRLADETGSDAPTNFDTAKQIIGPEIVKAIIAGGGGVTERQAMEDRLSRDNSPAQLLGTINTARKLLGGQLAGLKHQYEATTGLKQSAPFDDLLLPRAREVLGEAATDAGKARAEVPEIADKAAYDALAPGARFRKAGDPPNAYRTKQ